jgi:hypothetical protein
VITAAANIFTGVKLGATLANDDVSRQNFLSAEFLYAKSFGLGIASVTGTTACFLMCHKSIYLSICTLILCFSVRLP